MMTINGWLFCSLPTALPPPKLAFCSCASHAPACRVSRPSRSLSMLCGAFISNGNGWQLWPLMAVTVSAWASVALPYKAHPSSPCAPIRMRALHGKPPPTSDQWPYSHVPVRCVGARAACTHAAPASLGRLLAHPSMSLHMSASHPSDIPPQCAVRLARVPKPRSAPAHHAISILLCRPRRPRPLASSRCSSRMYSVSSLLSLPRIVALFTPFRP
jgi:hypothetical protein